ncbi:MAG: hypothetical protein HY811_11205 [Planctomycetes bacterium]|nr:hypothetical protein [Planctomycetota bacterium]
MKTRYLKVTLALLLITGIALTFLFYQGSELLGLAEGSGQSASQPSKGSWIKYRIMRSQMDNAGFKEINTAYLRISVIGENTKKSPPYYEVELVANEKTEQMKSVRFRVDSNGQALMDTLVVKLPNEFPVEINPTAWSKSAGINSPEQFFTEMLGSMLIIPFEKPNEKSEAEHISIKADNKGLGSFDCQRYLIRESASLTGETVSKFTKIWFADSGLPFPGVAKMLIFEERYQTQILPVEYSNSGATSFITDNPIPLDFKDKK